jgi:RNA exonuclease 1
LANVQFTLRHAQAFLMALCSDETVIVGHALHNDFAALKMEHHCSVDSSFLFPVKDAPNAMPSLKDLAASVIKKEMPQKHDSVNDARAALLCLEAYLAKNGKVAPLNVHPPETPLQLPSPLCIAFPKCANPPI